MEERQMKEKESQVKLAGVDGRGQQDVGRIKRLVSQQDDLFSEDHHFLPSWKIKIPC